MNRTRIEHETTKAKRKTENNQKSRESINVWKLAQKRPLIIEFRQVQGNHETIQTPCGPLVVLEDHVIARDEAGEYPIRKDVFAKTYDVLPDWLQKWKKTNEPYWKSDLIGRIWAYAQTNHLTIGPNHKRLPPGLGDLVRFIRNLCDRCGKPVFRSQLEQNFISMMNPMRTYQCCRVETKIESYTPNLCPQCHDELEKIFPHPVISV
jgi:hypothetical protein